jgi:formyl-CoA transferase
VIEVASFIAGPYAGSLLADLGADVIKVEAPEGGDPFRGWDTGTESASFWAYNRGKRSITLNLREPAAIDVLHRLVRSADVLLETCGRARWIAWASGTPTSARSTRGWSMHL